MLLQAEKERVSAATKIVQDTLPAAFDVLDTHELVSVYKSLANVQTALASILKVTPLTYRGHLEQLTKEEMEKAVTSLLIQVVEAGTNAELVIELPAKYYKSNDFAEAMGVTQATVSNWIKSGRLIGIEKNGKNKHALIPETAIYFSVVKEKFTVKEIMETYQAQLEHCRELPVNDTNAELKNINAHFTKKYNGSFFETLAKKKKLNSFEERDAAEWEYVLDQLDEVNAEE